jgi:hypothetical protein
VPRIAPDIFRKRLLSCADFDDAHALEATRAFFELTEWDTAAF